MRSIVPALSPEAKNMLLGRRMEGIYDAPPILKVVIIIPAYNEHASIARAVRSVQAQTYPIAEIIVVDDCSPDPRTGEIARALGVTVIRTPVNQKTKARAQNYVLEMVEADVVFTIDGDTELDPDAIEEAMRFFNDPKTGVVCGFIIPKRVKTFCERGRFVEYLYSLRVIKPAQDNVGAVIVASGCFSGFRLHVLRKLGGFHPTNMAEDMYFTLDLAGKTDYRAYFAPKAVCRPIEPPTFRIYWNQVMRWDCGLFQNISVRLAKDGEKMGIMKFYWRRRLLMSEVGKRVGWLLYIYMTLSFVGLALFPLGVIATWGFWNHTGSWVPAAMAFGMYFLLQAALVWYPIVRTAHRFTEDVRKKPLQRTSRTLLCALVAISRLDKRGDDPGDIYREGAPIKKTFAMRLKKHPALRHFVAGRTYGPPVTCRMTWKAVTSIPAFLLMSLFNKVIFVSAYIKEWVRGDSLTEWKKGH